MVTGGALPGRWAGCWLKLTGSGRARGARGPRGVPGREGGWPWIGGGGSVLGG